MVAATAEEAKVHIQYACNVAMCIMVMVVNCDKHNSTIIIKKRGTQMMSGGFLMFPKIVSESGTCFTKVSIYSNRYGILV